MSNKNQFQPLDTIINELITQGPTELSKIITTAFNLAMYIERERFIGVEHYKHSTERRAYANGYKDKKLKTQIGTLHLKVPKTSDHGDTPFYPQALTRGTRIDRATQLILAEMYINGVSTRRTAKLMAKFGLEKISAMEVSRAMKVLEAELKAWRERPLGEIKYLMLDARYEKVRENGEIRSTAVLSAIGVDTDGHRRVLGTSVAVSEAEPHWRKFLASLVKRGMHGVEYVVSDDHHGLKNAVRAVFGNALWQRCQFHLARNAAQHAPNIAIKKRIGRQLRAVWNADNRADAEAALQQLIDNYRDTASRLADWLEDNIPEGLAVFSLPEKHQKRMRTSNAIERCIQQELKRRTRLVRVFPTIKSLLMLTSAILMDIDEQWATTTKAYVQW